MNDFSVPVSVRRLSAAVLAVSGLYFEAYIMVLLFQAQLIERFGGSFGETRFLVIWSDIAVRLPIIAAVAAFSVMLLKRPAPKMPSALPVAVTSSLLLCSTLLKYPLAAAETIMISRSGGELLAKYSVLSNILNYLSWLFSCAVLLAVAAFSVYCYAHAQSGRTTEGCGQKNEQMQ